MRKIRVMIVDGEAASRRLIGRALESDPGLELVGTAAIGPQAIEKAANLRPDLVVLAVVAGRPEGFEALGQLLAARPSLPVLIASAHARRGSPLTLEAISLGASGYLDVSESNPADVLRADLSAKVHALFPPARAIEPRPAPSPSSSSSSSSSLPTIAPTTGRLEAVVIGVSTGGPDALASIMATIPAGFPLPILIVQHILPNFTRSLSDRLDAVCGIPVREAEHDAIARPGTAWVAPIGLHMEVHRGAVGLRLRLRDGPPENLCLPSADVLFSSAARALEGRVLGVVLTGMGSDGLRGCREIRAAGGMVVVQDEKSSVVWGMPGSVAEAGLAHKILPVEQIGPEIVRLARTGQGSRAGI